MKIVITGCREIWEIKGGADIVKRILRNLPSNEVQECITGGCNGVDEIAFFELRKFYPHAKHRLILPGTRHQVSPLVMEAITRPIPNLTVMEMPSGTQPTERNDRMLDFGDTVLGFPLRAEARQPRNGTWYTIRQAEDRRKEIHIWMMEDDPNWCPRKTWTKYPLRGNAKIHPLHEDFRGDGWIRWQSGLPYGPGMASRQKKWEEKNVE